MGGEPASGGPLLPREPGGDRGHHRGLAGEPLLDRDSSEDSTGDVELNVVMTGGGRLIEVQATAERVPFSRAELDALVDLAAAGIQEIGARQKVAVA